MQQTSDQPLAKLMLHTYVLLSRDNVLHIRCLLPDAACPRMILK